MASSPRFPNHINYSDVLYLWEIEFNKKYIFLLRKAKIESLLNNTKIPTVEEMKNKFKEEWMPKK